mmetsp:Transcript_13210/g.30752  ORF Transcript_13210/g.30752 Transcript_13210/m.30752 type:complete len:161 (+) Transcript_13210:482-964(+)
MEDMLCPHLSPPAVSCSQSQQPTPHVVREVPNSIKPYFKTRPRWTPFMHEIPTFFPQPGAKKCGDRLFGGLPLVPVLATFSFSPGSDASGTARTCVVEMVGSGGWLGGFAVESRKRFRGLAVCPRELVGLGTFASWACRKPNGSDGMCTHHDEEKSPSEL